MCPRSKRGCSDPPLAAIDRDVRGVWRISRLLACCSMTCAAHPATRLIAKIGVNWSVGIPIDLYAAPE